MSQSAIDVEPGSELERWMIDQLAHIHVHDEHWPGVWLCGRCPYQNSGPICTKCGAPCHEGRFIGGVVVSR